MSVSPLPGSSSLHHQARRGHADAATRWGGRESETREWLDDRGLVRDVPGLGKRTIVHEAAHARVSRSVAELGPIVCGVSGSEFVAD